MLPSISRFRWLLATVVFPTQLAFAEQAAPETALASPKASSTPSVADHSAAQVAAPVVAPSSAPKRVAVLDFRANGAPEALAAQFVEDVAKVIAGRGGYRVRTGQDLKAALSHAALQQSLGCDADEACMAELTRALDDDLAVSGSLGLVGRSLVWSVVLVDTRKNRPLARASETAESAEAMRARVPGVIAGLFGWSDAKVTSAFSLPKGKKVSFAVLDLKATGVSDEVAANLTQVLSAEIKSVQGTTVISREDIAAMLQLGRDKALLGCDEGACVTEIGGALGVDKLVAGNVGRLANSWVVNLRLLDVKQNRVDNRVGESFRGEQDQLLNATRAATRALLGLPSGGAGRIAVTSSEEGAEVFVDDTKVGTTPLKPVEKIPEGRHAVKLSKSGFFDWVGDVYVGPGDTAVAWGALEARPVPWWKKAWVWAAAGTVIAGSVTTAVIATRPPPSSGSGVVVVGP